MFEHAFEIVNFWRTLALPSPGLGPGACLGTLGERLREVSDMSHHGQQRQTSTMMWLYGDFTKGWWLAATGANSSTPVIGLRAGGPVTILAVDHAGDVAAVNPNMSVSVPSITHWLCLDRLEGR
jgi:hypothetical protein